MHLFTMNQFQSEEQLWCCPYIDQNGNSSVHYLQEYGTGFIYDPYQNRVVCYLDLAGNEPVLMQSSILGKTLYYKKREDGLGYQFKELRSCKRADLPSNQYPLSAVQRWNLQHDFFVIAEKLVVETKIGKVYSKKNKIMVSSS